MKGKTAASLAKQWPHGVSVEFSEAGVLLRPKTKPRQSSSKAFKAAPASDELASVRGLQNRFDREEWPW
jgi:hypothetical protein